MFDIQKHYTQYSAVLYSIELSVHLIGYYCTIHQFNKILYDFG